MKTARPEYILHLRPEPGVDPVPALQAALKTLLRRFGLRCVRATVTPPPPAPADAQDIGVSTIEVSP